MEDVRERLIADLRTLPNASSMARYIRERDNDFTDEERAILSAEIDRRMACIDNAMRVGQSLIPKLEAIRDENDKKAVIHRVITGFATVITVVFGALTAALLLWPPHG